RLSDALVALVFAAFLAALAQDAYALSVTHDELTDVGAEIVDVTRGEATFTLDHPPLPRMISGHFLHALRARDRAPPEIYAQARRGDHALQWGYEASIVFEQNPGVRLPFAAPGADSVVVAARLAALVFPLTAALVVFLWARRL